MGLTEKECQKIFEKTPPTSLAHACELLEKTAINEKKYKPSPKVEGTCFTEEDIAELREFCASRRYKVLDYEVMPVLLANMEKLSSADAALRIDLAKNILAGFGFLPVKERHKIAPPPEQTAKALKDAGLTEDEVRGWFEDVGKVNQEQITPVGRMQVEYARAAVQLYYINPKSEKVQSALAILRESFKKAVEAAKEDYYGQA